MHIGQVMTRKLVTTTPETKISTAFNSMVNKKIAHLPVLNRSKELVGIISDRDIRKVMGAKKGREQEKFDKLKVKEIMTSNVVTVNPGMSVSDAVKIMLRMKVGSLPVVDEGTLSGIVTKDDMLGVFTEMLRVIETTSTLDVELVDEIDDSDAVLSVLRAHKVSIISYSATPPGKNHRQVCHFRLKPCKVMPLVTELKRRGVKVVDAYGEDT